MRFVRLTAADNDLARTLFVTMAAVFDEPAAALGDEFLERLLSRDDFWAIAALDGDDIVGGLTAHTLPMTKTESFEVFIFDIAVRQEHQRKGIGRGLISDLKTRADAAGISDVFVAAENDDIHALDFYRALGGAALPVTMFSFD